MLGLPVIAHNRFSDTRYTAAGMEISICFLLLFIISPPGAPVGVGLGERRLAPYSRYVHHGLGGIGILHIDGQTGFGVRAS